MGVLLQKYLQEHLLSGDMRVYGMNSALCEKKSIRLL